MKISIDDIANPNDVILASFLECPIDTMISFDPVMCTQCETLFCKDCITNWKSKSNICPMRCNPIEIVPVDKTIVKQQISKIKLKCPFASQGCQEQLITSEVSTHEKYCEYRGMKCEKCSSDIPIARMSCHLIESCTKNLITCILCNGDFNYGKITTHLESCEMASLKCKFCYSSSHNEMMCPMKIVECSKCKLPEINVEIFKNSHVCLIPVNDNKVSSYLNNLYNRYEAACYELVMKYELKVKDFVKKVTEISSEILKKGNEKKATLENKLSKKNDDLEKKLVTMRKDRNDMITRIESEIKGTLRSIEEKQVEKRALEEHLKKKRELLKTEYSLKLLVKRQNVDYLRTLFLQITTAKDAKGISNSNSNSFLVMDDVIMKDATSTKNSITDVKASINPNVPVILTTEVKMSSSADVVMQQASSSTCKKCSKILTDSIMTKCNACSSVLCKTCIRLCPVKTFDHTNNGYCEECFSQCTLCLGRNQCKMCIKRCFFKNCPNLFCNSCFERNKHQVRPESTNCNFYKCDSCQTEGNCIITTVYCSKCDKRVCKICYHKDHKPHMVLK